MYRPAAVPRQRHAWPCSSASARRRRAPIREINPEIPDWLVAIIDKLHAKDPAERFQSAAEVAELLGRHLAHVQHPSVVGPVVHAPPGEGRR